MTGNRTVRWTWDNIRVPPPRTAAQPAGNAGRSRCRSNPRSSRSYADLSGQRQSVFNTPFPECLAL